jgi:hypothetical protein
MNDRARTHHRLLSVGFGALIALGAGSCANERTASMTPPPAEGPRIVLDASENPTDLPGLEHVLHLTPELISGGEPEGDAGYDTLRSLGVRTLISTDAVAPDAARAEAAGIRVVHLPIGYDGVPSDRAVELAAALRDLPGPVYVHCHHGKHRGPAAICVGAVGAGLISNEQALWFMERAGTSRSYPGLWRDASAAETLDQARLDRLARTLPSIDIPEGTPAAMATIDRAHERLWVVADNAWIVPEDHPDLAPASDAGLIRDLLRSLQGSKEVDTHGDDYAERLSASAEYAAKLEQAIDAGDQNASSISLQLLLDSCIECHSAYRN